MPVVLTTNKISLEAPKSKLQNTNNFQISILKFQTYISYT